MSAVRPLLRFLLVLVLLLVTASLVVPYDALERIHAQFSWIGRGDAWLGSVVPGLDLHHFAAFAAAAFLAPLAGVRPRFGTAATALVLFAVLTEFAQGLVPGRSPQLSDAVLDVLGGGIGYLLGYGLAGPCAQAGPRHGVAATSTARSDFLPDRPCVAPKASPVPPPSPSAPLRRRHDADPSLGQPKVHHLVAQRLGAGLRQPDQRLVAHRHLLGLPLQQFAMEGRRGPFVACLERPSRSTNSVSITRAPPSRRPCP